MDANTMVSSTKYPVYLARPVQWTIVPSECLPAIDFASGESGGRIEPGSILSNIYSFRQWHVGVFALSATQAKRVVIIKLMQQSCKIRYNEKKSTDSTFEETRREFAA